ncbi:MAG: hypothetical protein ACI9F9_003176, partial [Candidatus Paceibacteria bacterium]
AAAGLVSHGPMDFGPEGSEKLVDLLPASQWIFLESEHMRWASSLSRETVKAKDRERLEGNLDRLRVFFPDIPKKVKKLDPWLRIHLMAQRGEDFYERFQKLLGVTDADFPESRQNEGPYMGNGRFLGEKGKFEVLLHVNRTTHRAFTSRYMGVNITDAVRWHLPQKHKMIMSVPAVDSDLKIDRYLHPHCVHNLSHLMLCAYKHFSFDPPVWLDEGLAHAMEQEIDPDFHTLDGEEGSLPDNKGPADWNKELKRLLKRGDLTGFAQLMRIQSFGKMDQDDHVSAYGMVRFLIDERPEEFAALIGSIKGRLDDAGYPDGSGMLDVQRAEIKRLFAWSPSQLDAAWKLWIEAR